MSLADRIVVMNDGVLQQVGTPVGGLSPSRQSVRRTVHRLAGHEHRRAPPCARMAARRRCHRFSAGFDLPAICCGMLERQEGRRSSLGVSGPRACWSAANRQPALPAGRGPSRSSPTAASTSSTSRSADGPCARAPTAGFVGKAGDQVWARIDPSQAHFFDTSRAPRSASDWLGGNMARIRLENISKSLRPPHGRRGPRPRRRRRRVLRAARPDRRRQDHDAAPDRRARKADRRPNPHQRRATSNDWGPAERDVALVLQQYSLYPRLTVRENLELSRSSRASATWQRREIEKRIDYASRTLRIEHICSTARPTGCRAARCSASRSAAPSCASRRSS